MQVSIARSNSSDDALHCACYAEPPLHRILIYSARKIGAIPELRDEEAPHMYNGTMYIYTSISVQPA